MRKRFAALIVASMALTMALGIAYAWTASSTGSYSNTAGTLSVQIANDAYTGNQLYPTNNPISVLTGQIKNNTAANPGINVNITGGSVAAAANYVYCQVSGSVSVSDSGPISPGGTGGAWSTSLSMQPTAPNDCQGATIGYNVTIDVATP